MVLWVLINNFMFSFMLTSWSDQYNEWIDLRIDAFRIRPVSPLYCCMGRRGPLEEVAFLRQTNRIQRELGLLGEQARISIHLKFNEHLPRAHWVPGFAPVQHPQGTPADLLAMQVPRGPFRQCTEVNLSRQRWWIVECVKSHRQVSYYLLSL